MKDNERLSSPASPGWHFATIVDYASVPAEKRAVFLFELSDERSIVSKSVRGTEVLGILLAAGVNIDQSDMGQVMYRSLDIFVNHLGEVIAYANLHGNG